MNEQEIYERVTMVEQSVKSAHHRIDELAETHKSISEIMVEVKYIRRDLNRLIERMNNVESAPTRRYNHIINAGITALVAAAVSLLLN